MPIYEYKCDNCGHELEALQKMSDDPLTTCPSCNSESLTKKISAAAFRLKGGGWYETDFKSGNKKNLASSEKTSGEGQSGSASGSAAKQSTAASNSSSKKAESSQ